MLYNNENEWTTNTDANNVGEKNLIAEKCIHMLQFIEYSRLWKTKHII